MFDWQRNSVSDSQAPQSRLDAPPGESSGINPEPSPSSAPETRDTGMGQDHSKMSILDIYLSFSVTG